MTTHIYDIANQLERAIRALPDYQAAQKAKAAIEADATSQALFTEFMGLQEQVHLSMQSGQLPDKETQAAIEAIGEKIESNADIKAYLEAQQGLSVYISDMERIVFKPLQELTDSKSSH